MLLHHKFIETAKAEGDKIAIIDRTTGSRVTYSKALIASLILAKKFQAFDPGALGIMIPTSAGAILTVMGSLFSGRTPVMINYSTGAAANAKFAQEKCGFKTIITSKALLEKINCPVVDGMIFIEEIMDSISALDKLRAALKSKLPRAALYRLVRSRSEDDNLIILFTSGSEKEPKAVQLTHRNIRANVQSLKAVLDLGRDDIFLANLPYFHVLGQTANLWLPLHDGMTIVTYANPLEFKEVVRAIKEERVTLMAGTPSFFRGYLNKSEAGDFAALRISLVGADKCPDDLREAWEKKHGVPLLEAYGTTETSPGISTNAPAANRPGSVGKAMPGVDIRIEHLETGAECAAGEIGKILVKGDLVMKGYLNDVEETSRRIRGGWYDTGDMGRLDDHGYLWLEGRLKRFVKIGGEMVSLVRVETVLGKLLPSGSACCVVELPDAVKGARIVAAIAGELDEKSILKKMAAELPNLALPKKFVYLDEFPMMGSGKIDFRSVTKIVSEMAGPNSPASAKTTA